VPDDLADLSDPLAQELLESDQLARLAYAGLDGLPRVVPVGFLWTGGRIVVCTSTIAPKVRALRARPDVAVTIDRPSPAQALFVRGTAHVDEVDGVAGEYLAMAQKSMTEAESEVFEREVRRVYPAMARIAIEPTWARAYDFGAGRVPGFLKTLQAAAEGS
jgi:nitroimidazol reductase NimA-like FMN-containing flavoprotein (pyridoxamine 5'-phosphate oxidase superfamily)